MLASAYLEELTVVWNEVKPGLYELWLCCAKQCDPVLCPDCCPSAQWAREEYGAENER